MKRFALIMFLIFLWFSPALAADVVQTSNGYASYRHNENMKTATFTITADGSGDVAIFTFLKPQDIYGFHLLCVEMKCAADDDAFTVLIYTNAGATMFSHTTTAGTTGEIVSSEDRWPINAAPKIDITGLTAAKIVTVIVTFVR